VYCRSVRFAFIGIHAFRGYGTCLRWVTACIGHFPRRVGLAVFSRHCETSFRPTMQLQSWDRPLRLCQYVHLHSPDQGREHENHAERQERRYSRNPVVGCRQSPVFRLSRDYLRNGSKSRDGGGSGSLFSASSSGWLRGKRGLLASPSPSPPQLNVHTGDVQPEFEHCCTDAVFTTGLFIGHSSAPDTQ